ncbi:MAG: TrkH family potassium uptake protein [Bacilli bacterium]|nr:TrkH family potassium uptake protein [Bacilli bacterium]
MNIKAIFYNIGNLLKVEAGLLTLPLIVSFIYHDGNYFAFLIPILLLLTIGFLVTAKRKPDQKIYAKEGFVIVGLSWIIMSLFGALPFYISREIPSFINAFFETASGFTTTGATILTDIEALSYSLLFWRGFTHWIGGMGILVFVLAFMPNTKAHSIYIMKAESSGPQVGKIVSKVKITAQILYFIYIALTIIEIIFLLFKMPLYDSVTHAFATAGTGGFSIKNASIAYYDSVYIETVITVFMFLFGINFTVFYLILIGNVKQAIKSEEFRWYFIIAIVAITLVTINCYSMYGSFGRTLRYSSFQVISVMTCTGFSTFNFNIWPMFSKTLLIILMMIGACAGSTGGGLKISRVIIYIKMIVKEIKYSIHPRQMTAVTFDKKPVDESILKGISHFLIAYISILLIGMLILSLDGYSFTTNFTAVVTCFSNCGPGLDAVGPVENYSSFSVLSKLVLTFVMLAGRLEIFPMLILFTPRMWKYR